jgi:hypothetical protein
MSRCVVHPNNKQKFSSNPTIDTHNILRTPTGEDSCKQHAKHTNIHVTSGEVQFILMSRQTSGVWYIVNAWLDGINILILTKKFAVDLGTCLLWRKPAVPCLWSLSFNFPY